MRPPFLGLASLLLLSACTSQCFVKKTETVDFYPTYVYKQPDGKWAMPVMGLVRETEPQAQLQKDIAKVIQLVALVPGSGTLGLEEKVTPFLVRGKSGAKVPIEVDAKEKSLGKSDEDGFLRKDVVLDAEPVIPASEDKSTPAWLTYSTPKCKSDPRTFKGQAVVIPPAGISVVANLEAVRPVEGGDAAMASAFRQWNEKGAVFHYLSSQPWQLYGSLSRSMEAQGYPPGVLQLKTLPLNSLGGSAETMVTKILSLLSSPGAYNRPAIEALLQRFPQRDFLLIGSGLQDAETFAVLARKYPDQVTRVRLRENESVPEDKYRALFKDLPPNLMRTFRTAEDLKSMNL